MKYLLLNIIFTTIIIFKCQGQDENFFKRLHGTVVKDNLFLRNNGTASFQYKIDNETNWRDIKKDKVFNVSNNHNNTIGVYIKFYNPLKYKFQSSFKDVDDPINQSLNQFLSSFPAMETITSLGTTPSNIAQRQNAVNNANGENKDDNLVGFDKTVVLFQWVYEFLDNADFVAIKGNAAKKKLYNSLVRYINSQTKLIDDYLYGKITFDNESKISFTELLNILKNILFNSPSDYELFLKEINNSKNAVADIELAKKRAEDGLKNLRNLLSEDFETKIEILLLKTKVDNFKNYSSSTASMIFVNTEEKMNAQKETLEKFSKLVVSLSNFTQDFNKDIKEYRLENQPAFDWQTTTMRNFTCEIKELDIDGIEVPNKKLISEFTVAKDEKIVPFVSTGVFYTDFHYPNYALQVENGINKIEETPTTYVRVRPSVFLNMMFQTKSNWFYPFLQLGVSTGVDDFIIPFGGGLALSHNFSISGGSVFGLRNELTNLHVGDIVADDATLKNDLSHQGFFSWYISLNYNFIKKKK